MFVNTGFSYNGKHSLTDFDNPIYLIRMGSSNAEGSIIGNITIDKEMLKNDVSVIKYGVRRDVLTFTLTMFAYQWTDKLKDDVIKWLFYENYKPLISDDYPDVIYYCVPVGDCRKYFYDVDSGYITIPFECNAPWAFKYQEDEFDLSDIVSTTSILVENKSNINKKYYYPEVEFTLQDSNRNLTLENITLNESTIFTNLDIGETITFNGQRERIVSDLGEDVYRYDNHNGIFLRLVQGFNEIEVTGKCILKIKSYFPYVKF